MTVKVSITDLQTHHVYRGRMLSGYIETGKDLSIALDNPHGRVLRIRGVRGWVASDSDLLAYLMDMHGRRFKLRIYPPTIIESIH